MTKKKLEFELAKKGLVFSGVRAKMKTYTKNRKLRLILTLTDENEIKGQSGILHFHEAGYLLILIGGTLVILAPFIFIITFVFYPHWWGELIGNWINSFIQGLGL